MPLIESPHSLPLGPLPAFGGAERCQSNPLPQSFLSHGAARFLFVGFHFFFYLCVVRRTSFRRPFLIFRIGILLLSLNGISPISSVTCLQVSSFVFLFFLFDRISPFRHFSLLPQEMCSYRKTPTPPFTLSTPSIHGVPFGPFNSFYLLEAILLTVYIGPV